MPGKSFLLQSPDGKEYLIEAPVETDIQIHSGSMADGDKTITLRAPKRDDINSLADSILNEGTKGTPLSAYTVTRDNRVGGHVNLTDKTIVVPYEANTAKHEIGHILNRAPNDGSYFPPMVLSSVPISEKGKAFIDPDAERTTRTESGSHVRPMEDLYGIFVSGIKDPKEVAQQIYLFTGLAPGHKQNEIFTNEIKRLKTPEELQNFFMFYVVPQIAHRLSPNEIRADYIEDPELTIRRLNTFLQFVDATKHFEVPVVDKETHSIRIPKDQRPSTKLGAIQPERYLDDAFSRALDAESSKPTDPSIKAFKDELEKGI